MFIQPHGGNKQCIILWSTTQFYDAPVTPIHAVVIEADER